MSTAVATGTETLEGLDFEISCQSVFFSIFTGRQLDACSKTATHTATIHKVSDCQWVEKFLCDEHAADYKDPCFECSTVPRIKDCQHLGTHI